MSCSVLRTKRSKTNTKSWNVLVSEQFEDPKYTTIFSLSAEFLLSYKINQNTLKCLFFFNINRVISKKILNLTSWNQLSTRGLFASEKLNSYKTIILKKSTRSYWYPLCDKHFENVISLSSHKRFLK